MTGFAPAQGAVRVLAPCKVNLALDVGARRADGYHDLDSIVATFLPADELTIRVRRGQGGGITLTCDDPSLPTDERNLVHRAAGAFLARFAPGGAVEVSVHLAKRVPAEAGLGGGSSDAAATLRALDRLLPGAATRATLSDLAAGLGSDVPLFLGGAGGARMGGRGERVTALPVALPALHGVLVKPGVGVPTGPAYALLDALPGRTPGGATGRLLAALRAGGGPEAVGAAMGNDFEAAVLPAYPDVARAHPANVGAAGAVRALLCGSGSAVFGLARDRGHARASWPRRCAAASWVKLATMTGGVDDKDA